MQLSVKTDYAARAVLGLARRFPAGSPCRTETLAAEYGIPPKYLGQILLELKAAQIVRSQRGKEGGYVLARAPAAISLGDVLRAVTGQVVEPPPAEDQGCPFELRQAWEAWCRVCGQAADGVSFQAILDAGLEKARMYYI